MYLHLNTDYQISTSGYSVLNADKKISALNWLIYIKPNELHD